MGTKKKRTKKKHPTKNGKQDNLNTTKPRVVDLVDSETEGFERSATEVWLKGRGLNEFVEILKANKMDIKVLLECSRDELFEIFKGIGLKPYENVRLRFAITSDKEWKGGLDVIFALKEQTYAEVQQISVKLSESSATLSMVEKAKRVVDKTCDDYLVAITSEVEKIRTDAHQQIEKTRVANEEIVKALTKAQQEIHSIVKGLPIHDNKGREDGITNVMLKVKDLLSACPDFSLEVPMSPKPDLSKLRESIDSFFILSYVEKFKWDKNWISCNFDLQENGLKITCSENYNQHMGVRGSIGWTKGIHVWKVKITRDGCVSSGQTYGCNCQYCRHSIIIGVCSDFMTKNEIKAGNYAQKEKNVGYTCEKEPCQPKSEMISGSGVALKSGELLELTLDMTVRTLKIKPLNHAEFMVVRVPKGKIFPWVNLRGSCYKMNSCVIIDE